MLGNQIPFDKFTRNSRVVFFTGAGISAESGISTFRDPDGHWSKYDPMKLASPEGFRADPELVLGWYAARRQTAREAQPNKGHLAITQFQKLFPNSVVITQNVDGLHARAGNDPVWELHGNIHRHKCFKCGTMGELKQDQEAEINYCRCGGMLRPDVVWFGESLSVALLNEVYEAVARCKLFFTVGTSTQVYPAAQLPFEAQDHGAFVIEINPEITPFSTRANISIRDSAGVALPDLYEEFYAALS
ncbi:MAG: NAD-dependent deacylase [Candidatus Marinimicrobia bacterium]|nr:NAD-dependent deacylase [Candidatus Neomarinimicrobiota bacterium]